MEYLKSKSEEAVAYLGLLEELHMIWKQMFVLTCTKFNRKKAYP